MMFTEEEAKKAKLTFTNTTLFNRKMLELYLAYPREINQIISLSGKTNDETANNASFSQKRSNKITTISFKCILPQRSSCKSVQSEEEKHQKEKKKSISSGWSITATTTLFVAFALKEYIDNEGIVKKNYDFIPSNDTDTVSFLSYVSENSTIATQTTSASDRYNLRKIHSLMSIPKMMKETACDNYKQCLMCKKYEYELKRLSSQNTVILNTCSSICKANKRLESQINMYESTSGRKANKSIDNDDNNIVVGGGGDAEEALVKGDKVVDRIDDLENEIKYLNLKVTTYKEKIAKMKAYVANVKMWSKQKKAKYERLEKENNVLVEKLIKIKENLAYLKEFKDNNVSEQSLNNTQMKNIFEEAKPEVEREFFCSNKKTSYEKGANDKQWDEFCTSFGSAIEKVKNQIPLYPSSSSSLPHDRVSTLTSNNG